MELEIYRRSRPSASGLAPEVLHERAVKMNFIFGSGEGVAVGIDPYAFVGDRSFIDECLDILALDEEIDGRGEL